MTSKSILSVLCAYLLLITPAHAASPPDQPTVTDFGPIGMQRDIRQIRLRFSHEMVALGDTAAPAAATVACEGVSEQPRGRWVDGRRWVAEFANALPDGVICKVEPRALKTLSGMALEPIKPWRFNSGGPRVLERMPYSTANETAISAFKASIPVAANSLQHLTCQVNGSTLPVTILNGQERLDAWQSLYSSIYRPRSGSKIAPPDANWVLAACGKNSWPNSATVRWRWGRAIAATSGAVSLVDQDFELTVRPVFGVSGSCTHLGVDLWCDSRRAISLTFTAPISLADANKIVLKNNAGKVWQGMQQWSANHDEVTQWRFEGPFVPGERLHFELPTPLHDIDQRPLAKDSLLSRTLNISPLPPYLGMLQTSGVIAGSSNSWPLVVRNLEAQLALRRHQFTPANSSSQELIALHQRAEQDPGQWLDLNPETLAHPFALSQALLKPFAIKAQQEEILNATPGGNQNANPGPLSSLDIALKGYGTWVMEADSPALRAHLKQQLTDAGQGASKPGGIQLLAELSPGEARMRQRLLASYGQHRLALVQQTNLRISASMSKHGDSLVWLSGFDTGLAMPDVSLEVWSCDRKLLLQSKTDSQGRVIIPAGVVPKECIDGNGPGGHGVWLIARQGDDRVLLHVRLDRYYQQFDWAGHTITDRLLLHAGETVSMQHVLRQRVRQGWAIPGADNHVKVDLKIVFQGEVMQEQALQWQADGTADSTWTIPANAKLGVYHYSLIGPGGNTLHSGSFQVEEFKTPAFDAQLSAKTRWQGVKSELDLRGSLSFFAGGAAAGQAVTLKGQFRFGAHSPVAGYQFEAPVDHRQPGIDLPEMRLKLNQQGQFQRELATPKPGVPMTFHGEMSFADPNGETQTQSTTMALWPARYKIGLRIERALKPQHLELNAIVLDENDLPVANHSVVLEGESATLFAALCTLKTDAKGRARCDIAWPWPDTNPDAKWQLRARADQAMAWQLPVRQSWYLWGSKAATLALPDGQPRAGDLARLSVRAPFLPASLLLSVEREGVLSSQLHQLTESSQEITVPMLDNFAPAVRLRAQFVRGSGQGGVQAHQEELNVLLDPATHRLQLAVTPAVASALPGQVVPVQIRVTHALTGKPAAGASVTLAAVDEALLALKDNSTWALFEPFWKPRPIDVFAYNLVLPGLTLNRDYLPDLEQVLWRTCAWSLRCPLDNEERFRHAPVAAFAPAPPPPAAKMSSDMAAGAQADAPRQNFSTLAAWRTHVQVNEQGEAKIDISLPDSLSKWRIVAMALQGTDRYGVGQAALVVSKPLQILSGLPQTVRSGDVVRQNITLRNTSARPMRIKFEAQASINAGETSINTPGMKFAQQVKLAAGENKVLEWTLTVPDNLPVADNLQADHKPPELHWKLQARDQASSHSDALQVQQTVVPLFPLTVREATLLQVLQTKSITLAQPANARAGGQIRVNWQASLVQGPIQLARAWMANYPYSCMEQRASKAVVSGDGKQWQAVLDSLPKHMQGNGLVSYFPETSGSEVLTAYLLDLAQAYQLPLPPEAKARMKQALQAALVREKPADWLPDNYHLAHRLALQAAIAPDLGKAKPVEPEDLNSLPTIALADWVRYLLITPDSPGRQVQLTLAASHLRSRYDIHGTRLVWRADDKNNGWWLMWSNELALARTLSLAQQWQAQDPSWKADLPLLAAALADKQYQGSWRTTTGNAWAVAALSRFQANSEAGVVSGSSQATLGNKTVSYAWPAAATNVATDVATTVATTVATAPVQPASGLSGPRHWASSVLPWPDTTARANPVATAVATLTLAHQGNGAPWATVQVLAKVPGQEQARGLSVRKTITPVQQKVAGKWSVGDVLKVRLEMNSELDMGWVVVHDPIPSGASILGKGLGRESQLAQDKVNSDRWWWNPGAVERGSDSYRGYYQRVWRGKWHTEYAVRLNNAGSFNFPATRIEAMYAPEIYGETPNAGLQVQQSGE
jgi:alpha-2-macroglobulin